MLKIRIAASGGNKSFIVDFRIVLATNATTATAATAATDVDTVVTAGTIHIAAHRPAYLMRQITTKYFLYLWLNVRESRFQ